MRSKNLIFASNRGVGSGFSETKSMEEEGKGEGGGDFVNKKGSER